MNADEVYFTENKTDLAQVFADPQVVHRQLQRTLTHPDGAMIPTVANPLNFSKTPVEYRHAPPRLGRK